MPNILAISYGGCSLSSGNNYKNLLPRLVTRAVFHESKTLQDAIFFLRSGWPNVVLVTNPVITHPNSEESKYYLTAVADFTRQGGTTLLIGLFAAWAHFDDFNRFFNVGFGLPWTAAAYKECTVTMVFADESAMRTATLEHGFNANALYLGKVPSTQVVYAGDDLNHAYAAYGKVGLGRLGYVGDVNFGPESERLILAMCHLDRPEDRFPSVSI